MNMTIKKNPSAAKTKQAPKKVNAKSNYDEAAEYIRCAISVLGKSAKESDVIARESIANLSVVLMDLK